jgi:hypothetical protein
VELSVFKAEEKGVAASRLPLISLQYLLQKVRKLKMTNCQIAQFDYWKDDTITSLMQELDAEYHKNQENRRLYDEYFQYINILKDISEKEQRIDTMLKLDIPFTEMLCKTERFYYLAGLNHAMRIIKNCCPCPECDICDCGFIHIGIKRNQESKMINYSLYQLETFILMKYVESPEDNIDEYINGVCQDSCRKNLKIYDDKFAS